MSWLFTLYNTLPNNKLLVILQQVMMSNFTNVKVDGQEHVYTDPIGYTTHSLP